jgi:alpha-glucosidase
VHELIAEIRSVIDEYDARVLIGEIYLPIERLVSYYGVDLSGAHLPFNFQLIQTAWNAHEIMRLVNEYEAALPPGGWPNWVLGNHDQPRIAARVGTAQARVAAMLLLTLRGTPTLYYGDEIGLEKVEIPPDRVQDPWAKNEPGLGIGRDPERTPMPWDASRYAGFSTVEPWLPLGGDVAQTNVATLAQDERSILTLYRRLIALRRKHPALSTGAYIPVQAQGAVLAYQRRADDDHLLILLNLSHEPETIRLPQEAGGARILLSTHLDREGQISAVVEVRPSEGMIIDLR